MKRPYAELRFRFQLRIGGKHALYRFAKRTEYRCKTLIKKENARAEPQDLTFAGDRHLSNPLDTVSLLEDQSRVIGFGTDATGSGIARSSRSELKLRAEDSQEGCYSTDWNWHSPSMRREKNGIFFTQARSSSVRYRFDAEDGPLQKPRGQRVGSLPAVA